MSGNPPHPPAGDDVVLETKGLVAGYETGLPIVNDVDFTLRRGAFVTILGPNGAGKSTFVKAIAGLVAKFGGDVLLNGSPVTTLAPHDMIRRGLAFVPQTENIFASMTIEENLRLCAAVIPDRGRRKERIEAAYAMFPDLGRRPGLAAGSLSGGQRQMLATARALLVDPSVLILDEPSAGLSPKLVGEVFQTIERVRRTGVAIVLVEQNVRAALAIADDGLVMVEGRVRHYGPARELVDDAALGAMFLGGRSRHASRPEERP